MWSPRTTSPLDGTGTFTQNIGNYSAGNGSTSSGTDTFGITSNNSSLDSSKLDMHSTRAANETQAVWGFVSSGGSGSGSWVATYGVDSAFHSKSTNPGVSKDETDATFSRSLTSGLLYNVTTGWNLTKDQATGTTTFTRNDSGKSDLTDTLNQNSYFQDVSETGDLSASNHDWKSTDFTRECPFGNSFRACEPE